MPKHYRPAGKKKEGNAAKYVTRSQAVKQLQVNLPLFRRLCILKGIFPREPKKKVKGTHQTYYHTKDILFLKHEPLVEKFREIKSYHKKVNKALSKKNKERADRLLSRKPNYKLDRLIRERYPRFADALGDLDDCLSMVHLFAALPSLEREKIGVERIHNCQRLSREWQAYVVRAHKLRKTFISVKGIYYQAEVEGRKITWITPHALQQVVTDDVDFGVMLTYLEFYETLLAFVNFKLYHSINLKYPPILDPRLEALAADLYALTRVLSAKSSSSLVESHVGGSSGTEHLEKVDGQPLSEPGALMHLVQDANAEDDDDQETMECKCLFKDVKFFLSREVPKDSLLFVISSFGGTVSWDGDGAPFKETDPSITHQIVDRSTQSHKFLSREYVQPQWVYDCANARVILPTDDYLVGSPPPPHLSPFVDNEAEGYVPDYAERIRRLQAAGRKQILPMPDAEKEDLNDPQNLLAEGIKDRAEANETAKKKQKITDGRQQYLEELQKELSGAQYTPGAIRQSDAEDKEAKDESPAGRDRTVEGTTNIDEVLMSRKQKKLYEAMRISRERKQSSAELLKSRKRRLEAEGK